MSIPSFMGSLFPPPADLSAPAPRADSGWGTEVDVGDGGASPGLEQVSHFRHRRALVLQQVDACDAFWTSITANPALAPHFAPRVPESLAHLGRLRKRILDTHSRVLVAGDLNSGKSTFINGLLGRRLVPEDQQPCTAVFAEILDVAERPGGVSPDLGGGSLQDECIQAIPNLGTYTSVGSPEAEPADGSTESHEALDLPCFGIDRLPRLMEEEDSAFEFLKVYCRDCRDPASSLLHNGLVKVSLIDSPGLNIDTIKTLRLLSSQEEIDVIVFVVNAENHITLSAQDFLCKAGTEKELIFVVVNRFDQIRKKDKCKEEIMKQLQAILPQTYSGSSSLVHFISAKACFDPDAPSTPTYPEEWAQMERCLRSFILEKRTLSKLQPVQTYLRHTLSHITKTAAATAERYQRTLGAAEQELQATSATFAALQEVEETFLRDMDKLIDDTAAEVQVFAKDFLSEFLLNIEVFAANVEWHGFFSVFSYAREIRCRVQKLALVRLKRCEDFALDRVYRQIQGVEQLLSPCMDISSPVQPGTLKHAMEQENADARMRKEMTAVPGHVAIGLEDFLNLSDKLEVAKEYVPSTLLVLSGLVSYRNAASFLLYRMDRLGKIVGAGAMIAGVAIFLYALSDLQNVVERKITGKLRASLVDSGYVDLTLARLGRSTRRVLRMTLWDYQNRFSNVFSDQKRLRKSVFEDVMVAEEMLRSLADVSRQAACIDREIEQDVHRHQVGL